ncbi:MAG: class I SAM-dependent RNA methyltransferase [Ahrensia sp.]
MTKTRLTIEALGAQGDGIAHHDGHSVFLPGTLPGEIVDIDFDDDGVGEVELIETSPKRVEPPCPHFGVCGGCSMQHVDFDTYVAWKRDIVVNAFAQAGLDVDIDPLVTCARHERRRVTLTASNTAEGIIVGFNEEGSNTVLALTDCTVMTPGIFELLPTLKKIAATCVPPGKTASIIVLETETGYDCAFEAKHAIADDMRRGITKVIDTTSIIRLSFNGEIIIASAQPIIRFDAIACTPPPGGFTQAVKSIEDAMAGLVTGHLGKSKMVVDLFSGSGTFTLPLARKCAVHAIEGEAAAVQSLERAWRESAASEKLRTVTIEKRDLFRSPLTRVELNDYRGLVFDPPRAGAQDQMAAIAKSTIETIAAVSCNPTTLVRDLAVLIDAGFSLEKVVPLDQFLWTPHVEVVALLSRRNKRNHRSFG